MRQLTYNQRLSGHLTTVGPGLVDVELVAVGETPLGRAVRLASQLTFADERTFSEDGTLELGADGALHVRTVGHGSLTVGPAPGMRHGTAVLEAEGSGRLAGARGRITSNFVVTDDGEVTDEQVVVVFIEEEVADA
jgi:hypothetical protein